MNRFQTDLVSCIEATKELVLCAHEPAASLAIEVSACFESRILEQQRHERS